MTELIATLPDGPVDIVGDVHGEIEALESLLGHLGYDRHGTSPDGRRLVFLGDLADRGPDSPTVIDKVIDFVKRGNADCLLGNHELNLLLDRPFPGNGWFVQPNPVEQPGDFPSRPVDPDRVADYLAFFASLPVVLENPSLRLVHACWHAPSVSALRRDAKPGKTVLDLYRQYERATEERQAAPELARAIEREAKAHSVDLRDPAWPARLLPAHAEAELIGQMANPVRVLTSGAARRAAKPTFAAGRWRMFDRTRWWEDYDDDIPVVIGHFWRRFDVAAERMAGVFGRDVFAGIPSHAWMGKKDNVYCVDYSVGQRYAERERHDGGTEFLGKLAALRYPEWEVHHDDGSVVSVG